MVNSYSFGEKGVYTYLIKGQISYFYVVFWKNLHSWKYFHMTAGRDDCDKFQIWDGIGMGLDGWMDVRVIIDRR